MFVGKVDFINILYQAKKEAKRKRDGDDGDDLMGYTNDSNPFGDSNLTEKFVWKLKHEKEEKKGIVKDPKADLRRKEEIRVCIVLFHLISLLFCFLSFGLYLLSSFYSI